MELAGMHAALADPLRLAIAQYLYVTDATPGQLAQRFEVQSNLMAHHIGTLVAAGLVTRRRSEHDHRRQYVQLAQSDSLVSELVRIGLAQRPMPGRVLFVCTRNSARSKLASALWRRHSPVPSADAGTDPGAAPNPTAAAVAERLGLALERGMHDVESVRRRDDLVITVCDHVQETWAHDDAALHWSVPDPVPLGREADFVDAAETLEARISVLAPQFQEEHNHDQH